MKILFIADNAPGLHSGSAVRNYYLYSLLSKSHAIDLVELVDESANNKSSNQINFKNYKATIIRKKINVIIKIKNTLQGKLPYIEQRKKIKLPDYIINKLHTYDIIHLAEINSYYVIEKYLHNYKGRLILDAHNVEYLQYKSTSNNKFIWSKLLDSFIANLIKRYELNAANNADHLLVCSDVDKKYFEKQTNHEKISVIPNGVNISNSISKISNNNNRTIILFMGLLSYLPNDEGLKYYIKHIHPALKKKIKNLEFQILGLDAPKWLREVNKTDPSINLVGFVDDPKKNIANAKICIAPLLSGSGTRLKILEYMALKKPVVTTAKGAEGIDVINMKNILLANTPNEFIHCINLINENKKLSKQIGENAYELVKSKYDWSLIVKGINYVYNK